MLELAESAASRGIHVLVAAAAGAAHLPGMLAAVTPIQVIDVPVATTHLDGLESLYSRAQMSDGCPAGTMGVNNSTNAALQAIRGLDSSHPEYIQRSVSPDEKAILALTFIGAIVGVLGIFWALLIPAAVAEEVVEEGAEIAAEVESVAAEAESEAEGLVQQAAGRVAEGLSSPKAVPGQGAAIYGSIPGALITGASSAWSKIVANNA